MLLEQIEKAIILLDIENVSIKRKHVLQPLINYIQAKVNSKQAIHLNFICTHNSRRSHLAQVWAQTMAHYFNINNVLCYSGGTEVTTLFSMIVKTLENSGFKIKIVSEGSNPIYRIKYADNEQPIIGFSKTYDDDFNPKSKFAAIMTCDSANEACPIVQGAEKRIPITFDDPKIFDNTHQQAEKYEERSLQIATEMKYLFSQIKSLK